MSNPRQLHNNVENYKQLIAAAHLELDALVALDYVECTYSLKYSRDWANEAPNTITINAPVHSVVQLITADIKKLEGLRDAATKEYLEWVNE